MKNVRFIFHFLKNRTISLDSVYNFVLKIYLIIAYRCDLIFRNETISFCWILRPSFQIRSKLDEYFRIYDSQFRVYLLRATIQASLFVFYLLSNFISRLSKIDPLAFRRERIEAWNCSQFWKKRRDKYCKYNIISMHPWRKNMEYGYFNWRESLWSTMKYIEKFRPYFQLYCSYLIPLSFILFYSFIYFQWNNSYLYILSKYLCH